MDRLFQRPSARVRMLQIKWTSFCSGMTKIDLAVRNDSDHGGTKAQKAQKTIFVLFLNLGKIRGWG